MYAVFRKNFKNLKITFDQPKKVKLKFQKFKLDKNINSNVDYIKKQNLNILHRFFNVIIIDFILKKI